MTFSRLVYACLCTWIIGSIVESVAWGLYFALLPIFFYEMFRKREAPESDHLQHINPHETTMAHPHSYQPELHPHLIKGLHHEAKLRGVPMTVLLRSIVAEALERTEGMQLARREVLETGEPFFVGS